MSDDKIVFRPPNWIGIIVVGIFLYVLHLADLQHTPVWNVELGLLENISHAAHVATGVVGVLGGGVLFIYPPRVIAIDGEYLDLKYLYGRKRYRLTELRNLFLKSTTQRQKDGSTAVIYRVEFDDLDGKHRRIGMHGSDGEKIYEALKKYATNVEAREPQVEY